MKKDSATWPPPPLFICGECGFSTQLVSQVAEHAHFVSEPDYPVRRRDDDTPYHWPEKEPTLRMKPHVPMHFEGVCDECDRWRAETDVR